MKFKSQWGHFEDGGKCYAITDPNTPKPWYNYLYSRDGKFQACVTQRGQGLVHYVTQKANSVGHGRNYCLLDKDSGRCWSLNGGDAPVEAEVYRCEHRPGHSIFKVTHLGVESCLTVAIDPSSYVEVNRLELENTSGEVRRISLIGVYDVVLDGVLNDNQYETSRYLDDIGAVLVQRRHFGTADFKYAGFYVSDRRAASYCGDRDSVFNSDCPRGQAEIWQVGRLANVDAHATSLIQALQHDITLGAGEKVVIHYGFGVADDLAEAEALARGFLESDPAGTIEKSKAFFEEIISCCPIQTNDEVLDIALNVWSKIQLHRQVIVARGSEMNNWRNNLQDAWGWMTFDPSWARHYLEGICRLAKADGFLTRTSPRVPGLSANTYYLHQRHNDIATWTAMLAARYAAETGDIEFFEQKVRYADGAKEGTIVGCVINAIRWLLEHIGQHGMILFLDGDWSDPLEEAGKKGIGESPWTSVALVYAIKLFSPLLRKLGYGDVSDEFEGAAEQLAQAVNEHAWDGQWYIRGITDDGVRFCTQDDPDANVSMMMQAWAIISGMVPSERMGSVLQALDDSIKTDSGPILYGPPFLKWRPEIGRETVKQPGTGENGSCYVHGGMMLARAEIAAGRPDEALKVIKQVLALRDPDCTGVTKAVPLWLPNFWHGPHSTRPGLSSGRISTGAMAWLYLDVCEGLLGIYPELDGLAVRPCFPSSWEWASFVRSWRGARYEFEFLRAGDVEEVVVELDGKQLAEPILPVPEKGTRHCVKVSLPK